MKPIVTGLVLIAVVTAACGGDRKASQAEIDAAVAKALDTTSTSEASTSTTTAAPATTATEATNPKTASDKNPALLSYCVQQAKKLYAENPQIGAGKDPEARCRKLIDSGEIVDRAGVDAEIKYTKLFYNADSTAAPNTQPATTMTAAPLASTTTAPQSAGCFVEADNDLSDPDPGLKVNGPNQPSAEACFNWVRQWSIDNPSWQNTRYFFQNDPDPRTRLVRYKGTLYTWQTRLR